MIEQGDFTAVAFDDIAGDRQAESETTASRRRAGAVTLEEWLENLFAERKRDTRAIIRHFDVNPQVVKDLKRHHDRRTVLGSIVHDIRYGAGQSVGTACESEAAGAIIRHVISDIAEFCT
ncbi:MAG: hypothetical protein JWQ55_3598, partial [Rhodopila sp.]|nr:hypothetical protein [Rhodopila sp.]